MYVQRHVNFNTSKKIMRAVAGVAPRENGRVLPNSSAHVKLSGDSVNAIVHVKTSE
jgi:hypothetical protein